MDLLKLGDELQERHPELKPQGDALSEVFAELVFATRIRTGLSQKQLAERAKVGVSTIHRIEGGGGGITDAIYQKVFKALGIDFSTLAETFNKKAAAREKELV